MKVLEQAKPQCLPCLSAFASLFLCCSTAVFRLTAVFRFTCQYGDEITGRHPGFVLGALLRRKLALGVSGCQLLQTHLGGVGTFGVDACVQEVAVTPGELTERPKAEG